MKLSNALLGAALALGLAGCGGGAPPGPPPATPLTIAEWEQMDVEKKYEPETFERLKLGEPKLRNAREWDRFLGPHLKRDMPLNIKAKR